MLYHWQYDNETFNAYIICTIIPNLVNEESCLDTEIWDFTFYKKKHGKTLHNVSQSFVFLIEGFDRGVSNHFPDLRRVYQTKTKQLMSLTRLSFYTLKIGIKGVSDGSAWW